jgi:hypothetical protein
MKSKNDRHIRVELKARHNGARIILDTDTRKYANRFGDWSEFECFYEGVVEIGLVGGGHINIQEFHPMEVKARREKASGRKARRRKVRAIRRHERQLAMMEIEAELHDQCTTQPQVDCLVARDGFDTEALYWFEHDWYDQDAYTDYDDYEREYALDHFDPYDDFIGDLGDWEPALPLAEQVEQFNRWGQPITDDML